MVSEFQTKGPFGSGQTTEEALAAIAGIRESLNTLKEQEAQLRKGLGIFKIEQPPSKEITNMDKVGHNIYIL